MLKFLLYVIPIELRPTSFLDVVFHSRRYVAKLLFWTRVTLLQLLGN